MTPETVTNDSQKYPEPTYDAVMRERLALVGSWASLVAGSPRSMSASHV
ncbi:hypothetical protein [Streptomyces sp. M3]|nr:hypothetical protein [Streptomyces sp. M3]